jgi:hypothetical protein
MKVKYSFILIILLLSTEFSFGQSQIGSDIDGEATGDLSGYSVSLSGDGNIVAVGAIKNNGNTAGHVKVYKKNNGLWKQLGSDIDGNGLECFGSSVSISKTGEILAIGGPCRGAGVVRIYKYSAGIWKQVGSDIKGEALSDFFGCAVSISENGNTVAVGAYANDGNSGNTGDQRGHVRVFENINNSWTQIGTDIDGEASGDVSGNSVSLSSNGKIVAIGSPRNKDNGTMYGQVEIYENVNNTWTQIGNDIVGEGLGDYFGYSVSINSIGDILAVGGFFNDASGSAASGNYGHVRVFKNIGGSWKQVGQDIDGEAKEDQSGYSVSINASGDIVAIGAPYNDGSGADAGHLRVYTITNNTWTQIKSDINGEAPGDQSGYSTAISKSGSTFATGAPYNDGTGTDAGHVRVHVSCNIDHSVDSIIACKSYKWTNGTTYKSSNKTATDTFVNSEGCDSIVSLRLTINQPTFKTISQNSCDNFISASLKKWVNSGIYNDTIPNFKGCDSIITYNLVITHTDSIITKQPTDQIVIPNGNALFILKSNNTNTKYQWQSDIGFGFINLSNAVQYSNVKGDTLKISNVTSSNNAQPFRCIVSLHNCYDTSQTAVLEVSTKSETIDVSGKKVFSIYPSPNNGRLFLSVNSELIGNQYIIYNTSGKVICQGHVDELITIVQLDNLNDGVYLFTLRNNNEVFVIRR